MVERHLRSTLDPTLEMGNVNGVQNKESQGMAPPLRPAGQAGGEEVEDQAQADDPQEVTVVG